MINNYLILLIMALATLCAGLASLRPRTPERAWRWAVTAVALAAVSAVLIVVNWVEST